MMSVFHSDPVKRVLAFTGAALIVSVVVACSLPSVFRARVVLQLPDYDSARFIYAALSGSAVQERVMSEADLVRVLGVRDTDTAREALRRMTEPVLDVKSFSITIDVVLRDPVLAAGIANAYRDALSISYAGFEDARVATEKARRSTGEATAQDEPIRFPGLVVIESASVPQHPIGPDRLLIIVTTGVVSFGLALLGAAMSGSVRAGRRDGSNGELVR